MAKKLFRNLFLLVFVNLLVKPLWIFGIDLQVQNTVGAENYGFYFVVFNFSFLFHIILDFGLHQFNNKEVAKNPSLLPSLFGKLFALKGMMAILYFAFTFCLALVLGYSFLQKKMLFFLAINQLLLSFILFSRSNFTAMQWYKWDAFFSVFDRVLSIFFCALLLYTSWFGDFEIIDFIYAQTIALTLCAALSLSVLAWKGEVLFPRLDKNVLVPLLKRSLPYAVVVLLMTIYTRIDAVMLEKLLADTGNIQAGVYAAAYRILDAVNMVPFLLASLLIPFFTRKLSAQEPFGEVLWTAFSLMIFLAVPLLFVIRFFHPEIIHLLYQEGDSTWYVSFQILLYTFPMVFVSYIFGGFLTAAGHLKWISIFALFTIVLNVALNYWRIPTHGAIGAAQATFFSQTLMAICQMVYVLKHWNTGFEVKLIYRSAAYMLVLGLSLFLINDMEILWFFKIAIFILLAVILSLILRLLNIQKLNVL